MPASTTNGNGSSHAAPLIDSQISFLLVAGGLGSPRACHALYSDSTTTIRRQGSKPALNNASIATGGVVWNCCATTPYRISGIDGTSSSPRLPEQVSRPSEKRSL